MFKDTNTGKESQLKDRIWSTIGDLVSRGYARVSAHTLATPNTVAWLTPEGHEEAKVVGTKVVDGCLLQRIPPRECPPMPNEHAVLAAEYERLRRAAAEHERRLREIAAKQPAELASDLSEEEKLTIERWRRLRRLQGTSHGIGH
jgi:hypothetical protein